MKRAIAAAGLAATAVLVLPAVALAHPTATFLRTKTTIRTKTFYVLGHKVRECSWRPGDPRVRGLVKYSRTRQMMVPGWAGAGKKHSRAACALNGGLYRTASPGAFRPSGTVYAQGRRIRGVMDAPAVGFLSSGRVVYGAAAARKAGSGNIMNAMAYIVSGGHPLLSHTDAPWTTGPQFSCGALGTDGWYGCDRSVVATFRSGRVGLVEIGHASIPLAARILVRMHVREAVTFDSGGDARLWTRTGPRNLFGRQVGHVFGTIMPGDPWHRKIADAIVINAKKAA